MHGLCIPCWMWKPGCSHEHVMTIYLWHNYTKFTCTLNILLTDFLHTYYYLLSTSYMLIIVHKSESLYVFFRIPKGGPFCQTVLITRGTGDSWDATWGWQWWFDGGGVRGWSTEVERSCQGHCRWAKSLMKLSRNYENLMRTIWDPYETNTGAYPSVLCALAWELEVLRSKDYEGLIA